MLGAIWGWVAYKQQSIFMTTLSDVLVNFFAFSELIADNWLHEAQEVTYNFLSSLSGTHMKNMCFLW